MQKTLLTLAILAISGLTFAQKHNVVNASIALKDGKYDQAKQYIDEAFENPNTSDELKMWMYRAKIYKEIALNHSNLDSMAIYKATESHMKCMLPHPKKKNKMIIYKKWSEEEVRTSFLQCANKLFSLGVDAYSNRNYHQSIKYFQKTLEIVPQDIEGLSSIRITEENLNTNLYLAVKALKNNEKSKYYLQKLIDNNSNNPTIYSNMSNILAQEGDIERAINYLEQGRGLFPEDETLINSEIDIYLRLNKTEELITKTSDAIAKNPDNEIYYVVRGQCYQNMNMIQKAILDYTSAIEINPDYLVALNNIAACYLLQTEPIVNKLNALNIDQSTKYKAYKDQVNALYRKALPYLKKYVDLKPEDKANQRVLKEITYKLDN